VHDPADQGGQRGARPHEDSPRRGCSRGFGASVITSVTADLGYSSFMRETVEYLERKASRCSSPPTTSTRPTTRRHVLALRDPRNGSVNAPSGDEWVRSDLTSWGAHNVLTAATYRRSTSESTPTLAGAVALLQAYGWKRPKKV